MCTLSAESALLNPFVDRVAAWMQEGGGSRSIEGAFFYMHTGKQYLCWTCHKHLGQTALFQSGSVIPILLYAYGFYLTSSARWAGMSRSLQINF